jgi:hypothetical protein
MRLMFISALLSAAVPGPLASEPLPGGGWLELHVRHDAGGPCIVIWGLPGGPRACGRAPSERVPQVRRSISAGPIVRRSAGSPVELYDETGPRVAEVIIRYAGPHGCRRTAHATLARATDRRSLSAAGIRRPFGYFMATVQGRVRHAWADARSGSGHLLGSVNFSRLLADGRPTTVFLEREGPSRP